MARFEVQVPDVLLLARRRLSVMLVAGALLLAAAGCGPEADSPSKRAQSRGSVDKQTATLLIQSQQALRQGALQAARLLADSVVARAPRLPDAHFQQGRVLSELKEFGAAEDAYREVLALDPDYRGAWYNLGNNAYRQQHYEASVTFYEHAQAQHPSAKTLVALGWTYVAQNEIDRARAAYEKALAADSSYTLAYARLGQLYDDQGDLERALAYSRQALKREPDNGKYQYAVGAQLLRLDRPEAAAEHLRRAADLLPWHHGAHFSLGQALMRLGREQEAERYLAETDSLEQLQSDIKRLRAVARSNADNPAVWKRLGEKLQASGQLDEAEQAFSLALYLTPGDPVLRNNLAMLLARRGHPEAAVRQFQAALHQHPSFVEGWFNLGVVYARSGHPNRARQAWREVLRYQPNHAQAKAYLARLASDSS